MADPFMLEKIRTGEDDPFEVVAAQSDGTVTVTNYDEGTVQTISPDGDVTTEAITDASN